MNQVFPLGLFKFPGKYVWVETPLGCSWESLAFLWIKENPALKGRILNATLLLQHHSDHQFSVISYRAGYSGSLRNGAWLKARFGLGCSAGFYLLLPRSVDASALTMVSASRGISLLCHQTPLSEGLWECCRAWLCLALGLWLLGAAVELLSHRTTAVRSCKNLPGLCRVGSFFSPSWWNEGSEQGSGFAVGSDHCSPTEANQAELIYTECVQRHSQLMAF